MRASFRAAALVMTLLLAGLASPPALATSIDPFTWEQLAVGADFLGVVECTVAGGIVAKYRVVDSWKGVPDGTEISIRVAVNFWEPQFPIALVGEQWLVAAYRSPSPARVLSTTSGGAVPFWWRDLPADYVTPLFQGLTRLPAEGETPFHSFQSPHPNPDVFRRAVSCLLEAAPEQQEVVLLGALARKYLFDPNRVPEGAAGPDRNALRKEFEARVILAERLEWLLALRTKHEETFGGSVLAVIGQGTERTIAALEAFPADHWIRSSEEGRKLLRRMREGRPSGAGGGEAETAPPAPTADALAALRAELESGSRDSGDGRAFETLTRHDPGAVAAWLREWKQPEKGWQDVARGYVLGSWFAARCGTDRTVHLKALADARDPFVRVAGAVYLAFEDPEAGTARLRDLVDLEGDPGAWAAITLIRRGEPGALGRALRVFETAGDASMAGVPHRNFQKHLLTVLSNSAARSGVEPPPRVHARPPSEAAESFAALRDWVESVRDRLTLHDPWFADLSAQKLD